LSLVGSFILFGFALLIFPDIGLLFLTKDMYVFDNDVYVYYF
jgi:hypothetical protein